MKKLRLYLDTSAINFIFADDAPEKKAITIDFFNNYIKQNKFEVFISDVVIEEIEKTRDENHKESLLSIISEYKLLIFTINAEALELADKYVEKGIIPPKKVDDARHLAIATINECDVLVSWNFKHLANINKEKQVLAVNIQEGYNYPLRLTTPMEVMGE
ncbi:MAG: type II toxin-antitoxin system VapC family toxin [Spirochaetales bacterium]|nr:type II toxin-antitoxin system VapC family toxin [Spirochaetales bacterium]